MAIAAYDVKLSEALFVANKYLNNIPMTVPALAYRPSIPEQLTSRGKVDFRINSWYAVVRLWIGLPLIRWSPIMSII